MLLVMTIYLVNKAVSWQSERGGGSPIIFFQSCSVFVNKCMASSHIVVIQQTSTVSIELTYKLLSPSQACTVYLHRAYTVDSGC